MTDPRMTPTNDAPVTVEQDPYLATIEEFEHEDQRELCRLYNHRPDDSLQFSRSNMREAIRHGRRLAALASAPAGDGYGKWHPMLLDLVNAIHRDRGGKTQAIGIDLSYNQALAAALARPPAAVGEPFPQPERRDGKPPCGECRLPVGETCDICGARQ